MTHLLHFIGRGQRLHLLLPLIKELYAEINLHFRNELREVTIRVTFHDFAFVENFLQVLFCLGLIWFARSQRISSLQLRPDRTGGVPG